MKSIYRKALINDYSRYESDAEHSWHLAMAAMLLVEYTAETIDITRVLPMVLVHDLVEIYAGDTFAYDTKGYEDKAEREQQAADKIFSMLPDKQGKAWRLLWEEFERMDTPDSRYAAALDRLLPFISNMQTQGHTWVTHGITAEQIFKRMLPVKTALPELWGFIEESVHEAREKGYIAKTF